MKWGEVRNVRCMAKDGTVLHHENLSYGLHNFHLYEWEFVKYREATYSCARRELQNH